MKTEGQEGRPAQPDLEDAIEQHRRDRFLEDVNAAYAKLRANSKAWKAEQDERSLWDKSLGDGLISDGS